MEEVEDSARPPVDLEKPPAVSVVVVVVEESAESAEAEARSELMSDVVK